MVRSIVYNSISTFLNLDFLYIQFLIPTVIFLLFGKSLVINGETSVTVKELNAFFFNKGMYQFAGASWHYKEPWGRYTSTSSQTLYTPVFI